MYLSWDSQLYTSRGWRSILELRSDYEKLARRGHNLDILVACCDIIGRVYWTFTRIVIIVHNINSRNDQDKYKYRTHRIEYDDGTSKIVMANGLVNTMQPETSVSVVMINDILHLDRRGWEVPTKGMKASYVSFDENGYEYDNQASINIGKAQELSKFALKIDFNEDDEFYDSHSTINRSVADVRGLPIGVIIDSLSIYPSNINDKNILPQNPKHYDFRRRIISPFRPISQELIEIENSMIQTERAREKQDNLNFSYEQDELEDLDGESEQSNQEDESEQSNQEDESEQSNQEDELEDLDGESEQSNQEDESEQSNQEDESEQSEQDESEVTDY
jgi:hypothetical protein